MSTSVHEILSGKSSKIHSVTPDTSVYEALDLMARTDISAVLVLEGERLVGIFTERDYARKVALRGRNSKDTRIREVMTENLLTVSPSQDVDDVMAIMTENRFRHLPVVDRGRLAGIVTIGDAVKAVMEEQRQTIAQLSSYISGDIAT
ncbi:CBS domain-containing protein [Uliginosibacterium sp. H3]|uniref:CBS domain-containing protein n=1 Tax=Uliginosibacterium silvisoli TaxID=3114758 RepID=A0ABU6JYT0_9RHOO|nr:CBS domain-containing protein [Uliginosibacterium sp. H3]